MQGLLLDVIQEAAPEAYAKRTKRQGIVNAFDDENFAQAVRDTGKWPLKCILDHFFYAVICSRTLLGHRIRP